jgi:hypothetical protein
MVAPAMADAIPVPRMMPNGTNQHRSERRGSSDEIEAETATYLASKPTRDMTGH